MSETCSPAATSRVPRVDAPEVAFVLVGYGSRRVLVEAVAALIDALAADGPPAGYEVVVVDNPHPRDHTGSADLLALTTSGVTVVRPRDNLGFGGGSELGIAASSAPLVCLLNPDVLPAPGWLGPLLAAVRRPDVGVAAPVLVERDGSVQEVGQRLFGDAGTAPRTSAAGPHADGLVDVVYSSAACWLLRREVLEAVGGFDADYHPAYYEDVDLSLRLRQAGWRRVVVPSSQLVHLHGGSTPDAPPDLVGRIEHVRRQWRRVLATLPRRPTTPEGWADLDGPDGRVLLVGAPASVEPIRAAVVAARPGLDVHVEALRADEMVEPAQATRFRLDVVAAAPEVWTGGLGPWCDRWHPLASQVVLDPDVDLAVTQVLDAVVV